MNKKPGSLGGVGPCELKAAPASTQILEAMLAIATTASRTAENVYAKLEPIMRNPPTAAVPSLAVDASEFPSLFNEMAGYLNQINSALDEINERLRNVELP